MYIFFSILRSLYTLMFMEILCINDDRTNFLRALFAIMSQSTL